MDVKTAVSTAGMLERMLEPHLGDDSVGQTVVRKV